MTAARAALLLLALVQPLGGCALLQPQKAPEAAAPVLRPVYRFEIDAPDELAALLRTHLDLARFREVPTDETIDSAEIDRLLRAAPVQARALLETEGYFGATVTAQREATPVGELPLVRVKVVRGPATRVSSVRLDFAGELETARAAGAAHAVDQAQQLRDGWKLKPGERFRDADWSDAKNSTLATLRAGAYPIASWESTEARIDAAQHTAQLALRADSGPRFLLGPVRVEGLHFHDASSITRLAQFRSRQPATERSLLEFQERVQKIGLFETVQVEIDNDPANAKAAPVTVRVREQPLQQATVGVGASANTGPRVTLEHVHRRPFDIPWIASNKVELGRDRRAWEVDFTSHPVPELYRNLVAGNVERLVSGDEVRTTGSARLGRTQDGPRIERTYYGEYLTERLVNAAGTTRSDALSANYVWVWRNVDNVLLPTDGQSLSVALGGGFARSNPREDGPFGRVLSRVNVWRPFGDRWYATARVELGQVWANADTGVPDALLFRAGGDESVRGYEYRSLGPQRDGVLASGRALATGSIELARPLSLRMPSLWGAVFVDAGNAAERFRDLEPVYGVGVGLRWRSPVGPLRVDLAYGEKVDRFRVHLSVGIAF